MRCPICNSDYYGNIKTQGVVYRKRNVRELKGDIWVCNKCYRKHQEHYLIDKVKDLDPAEIYDKPVYTEGHGVGGWLLLFTLSLTVFSPLLSGFNIISDYNEFSTYSNINPAFDNMVYTYLISTIALIGFGVFAGISLWTLKPYAVNLAKRYLWSLIAYSLIFITLPTLFSLSQELQSIWTKETLTVIIRQIVYAVIWLAYFNKSVRVKETYLVRDKTPSFDPKEAPKTPDEEMPEMEKEKFSSHFDKGSVALLSEDYGEAARAFEEAIHIKPDDVTVLSGLGVAYERLGRSEEAITAYKGAIRLEPGNFTLHFNLGWTYSELGLHEEAIGFYMEAIRLKPNDVEAHSGLGVAYLKIGNRSRALQEYAIIKELDRDKANELFDQIYKD